MTVRDPAEAPPSAAADDAAEALLGDLFVLTSLPALWIDRSGERIVEDALTLVRRMRTLDVACAQYVDGSGRTRQVIPAVAAEPEARASAAVLDRLPLMRGGAEEVHTVLADGAELRVVLAPLGAAGAAGTLALGSRRPAFPTRADRVVIDATANQAAIALRSASLYERLRDADQRKDEFLATLAHELRNPLGAISNAAQFLVRAERDPQRTEMLNVVTRQVGHLSHMIDGLLDVSRLTRGVATIERSSIDLRESVERAVASMRVGRRLDRHVVDLTLCAEPLEIDADEARIEQIIANLVDNATKFTRAGGRIEIVVERRGEAAEIRVRDEGVGIPQQFLPHVFELFAQAPRPLDRSSGGLGIGLAVVRELAHLHGGRVRAESEGPDRGSTFTVWLPLAPRERPRPPGAGAPPAERPAPRSVVLVEDNADARSALRQLLELDGHTVTVAIDGEQGVETILGTLPDVALVDVGLPAMDGYAVAGAVRGDPRAAGVTLVALTGYGQPADRERALAAGFDSHLVKPVDQEALARVLAGPARSAATGTR
ncbi:MAG TPA: ATP-binding protein [Candidatus Limnocylindria bacterium]|nr:ATP-binding protein [Candidatus Limnocylindria bacterium]